MSGMSKRDSKPCLDVVKDRISASKALTRLIDFVEGKIALSPHQVTAAGILLKKVVPDLQAVEHTGEVTQKHVVSAEPMTHEEWAATYGSERADRPH